MKDYERLKHGLNSSLNEMNKNNRWAKKDILYLQPVSVVCTILINMQLERAAPFKEQKSCELFGLYQECKNNGKLQQ